MKTAAFYDLENIGIVIKSGKLEQELLGLMDRIKASSFVGEIVLQKAYMRKNEHTARVAALMAKHGVELVAVEPMSNVPQKKSNIVDFKMGIDVTATILRRHSIKTVAIASGDSDFGFLCQQIKEMGKNLIVVSNPNITGDALFRICDDWLDSRSAEIKPRIIEKAINLRLPKNYKSANFYDAIGDFLRLLESDPFVCGCMKRFGLPFGTFVSILQSRGVYFPKHTSLGFANLTSMLLIIFQKTGYEYKHDRVYYLGEGIAPSQLRLLENIISKPRGYSREKLMEYYDIAKEAGDVSELLTYIEFMKRAGMLKQNELCTKRTFRAAIRKHLGDVLTKAGIEIDERALKKTSDGL